MLLTLGISHKTAPIEIREKLAFSPENVPSALQHLVKHTGIEEVALLSTCNRTELYCSGMHAEQIERILSWWQQYRATPFTLDPYFYVHADIQAVKHVMRVASGLDSMLIGEPQILGQLKSAYQTANEVGIVGKKLSRLFQASFSVAKRIRANTEIAKHPVSVAFAAVTLAKQIFSDLSKATVVLVGAGENIELLLRHLKTKTVKHIIIVNRTLIKAQHLAEQYDAQALPLTELSQALINADIVISSIDTAEPIITQKLVTQALIGVKHRPMLMIDLGVPRNIEPQLAQHDDVYLYSVDDLQGIVIENLKTRQRAAIEAEIMIEEASQTFMEWIHAQQKIHTVIRIRDKMTQLKDESLNQALQEIDKGKDPKIVIEEFAHRLTQRIMHYPTVGIRQVKGQDTTKLALIEELFSIE